MLGGASPRVDAHVGDGAAGLRQRERWGIEEPAQDVQAQP